MIALTDTSASAFVTHAEPWCLAVHAAQAGSEERARLAAAWRAAASAPDRLLLETCHRVELYGVGAPPAEDRSPRLLAEGAVLHLLRVAAGLESAAIGEDEVLHQVREALAAALAYGPHDSRLTRLFETAIAAGRKARAGRPRAVGLAERAIERLDQEQGLAGREVLVVGAGVVGRSLARAAARKGAGLAIASRSSERAARLARRYEAAHFDLAAAAAAAPNYSAVVVGLSGPWLPAPAALLPSVVDLSSPGALEPGSAERYLGIDDLLEAGAAPAGYVEQAERIAAEKAAEYRLWLERRR